jgi:predicted 3-demethylubiquinone-9 3-methyltransferase (glyoxalase superfamily)
MNQIPTAKEDLGVSRGPLVPCLWFDNQAEAAARFYTGAFPNGRVTAVSHYPQSGDNPSGKPPGSVLVVELEVAGQRFTALNGGPHFTINPSISFFVYVETAGEAERLFNELASGGEVLMPLGEYPWSTRYGWVKDRFGVSFQVLTGPRPSGGSSIAPCLMFTGARHGQAESALQTYSGIFRDARVEAIERYTASEGPERTVKHGRISIGGQTLIAMDSPGDHGFTFNEGISLQIMCEDQAELDQYWAALSDGGEQGPCGWLKDRFGVSWQVVPSRVSEWLTSTDTAARDRAFRAVMGMRKLDIAAIQAAFEGER